MTNQSGPVEASFQELLKRSDVVFHELRRMGTSPKRDLKAMAALASEARVIADKMAWIVRSKRASNEPRNACFPGETIAQTIG